MSFLKKIIIGILPSVFILSCVTKQFYFSAKKSKKSSLNTTIRDLPFFPLNGDRFRLSELKDKKAIVIVMRENSCPIFEKYGPRLIHLEQKYSSQDIQFIYNYVGQVKIKENAKKDLEKFGFKGPYVMDIRQDLISALGAQSAGQVFILTSDRKIIYKGPLDDQHHLLKSKLKPKNHYVADKLRNIVAGKTIVPEVLPTPRCIISRPIIKKKVFFEDVATIISKKCTICHNNNPKASSFINYLTYEDVAGRRNMFRYVIEHDLMPPWNVDPATGPWANDISLNVREKAMLLKWLDDGLPKKYGIKTISLWAEKQHEKNLAKPDYVIHLPEKVDVPAEDMNEYKYFVIPTSFEVEKWIKAVRFVTKPKVIHHMFLFIMSPSFSFEVNDKRHINYETVRKYALNYFITDGDPSKEQALFYDYAKPNEAFGKRLPRKSKLVLEIHYESIGQKVIDDFTHVKIYFHNKKPKYKSSTYFITSTKINIPQQESNYKMKTFYKIKEEKQLTVIHTHMHLRGKASSIFLIDPTGKRRKIFGIDPYSFNFQRPYILEKPITVEKGSILECVQYYDNSANNPINPDPTKEVNYGLLTTNEMNDCTFVFLIPANSKNNLKWIVNPN